MSEQPIREYAVRSGYLDHAEERVEKAVADLVQGLRLLADRIHREGFSPLDSQAVAVFSAHSQRAQDLHHILTWSVANLPMNRLFERSMAADQAARKAAADEAAEGEAYVYVLAQEVEEGVHVVGVHSSLDGAQSISGGEEWTDEEGDGSLLRWTDQSGDEYVIERQPVL